MPSQNIGLSTEKLATQGEAIHYTITLEPHNRLWLLMLDIPTQIPNDAQLMHDYSAMATSLGWSAEWLQKNYELADSR